MASARALTTSTYSLVKLLSPLKDSPVLVRSFSKAPSKASSDSDTPYDSSDSDSRSDTPPREYVCPLVNRFLVEGPPHPYDERKYDDAFYAKLDMPGIGKNGLKLWVVGDHLRIHGVEEPVVGEEDDPLWEPRKYSGDIDLPQNQYKVKEVHAVLEDGVLTVRVPTIKLEDRKDVIPIKVN